MDQTKIEWTDFTVNFWEGCQKVGPGCDHCYAEARDIRFTGGSHWGPGAPRRKVKGGLAKLRKINREGPAFEARHGHFPRVFCSSLSDVFDNAVDPAWRSEAFDAIEAATDTRVQMLTKRIGNVGRFVPDHWRGGRWPSHVGLMITVVNQAEADRDIPKLLALKAQFGIPWVGLSVEPMLGPVDLTMIDQDQEVIINCLTGEGGWRKDHPDAVIVARPSKWGNRFVVGQRYYTENGGHSIVRDRAHATELFRASRDARRWDIAELRGKDLACWCPLDQPCHADVLLEVANRPIKAVD